MSDGRVATNRMLRVALTGGIATGKSYVADLLGARGVPVIDADVAAREVVRPGGHALAAIVARFGTAVLAPDGSLDRAALAAQVFADAGARQALEAIVHPAVYEAIGAWLQALEARGGTPFAVADIPLLFETGHATDFDAVVVTACPPDEQIRRVIARDGATAEEARRRLAAQWPIAEKVRRADVVIDTSASYDHTERQVEALCRWLDRKASGG